MISMTSIEVTGYLASALVLAAFCMRDMVALRWTAIASNLAFIAYGALAELGPVLALHLLLLPINVLRLSRRVERGVCARCAPAREPCTHFSRELRPRNRLDTNVHPRRSRAVPLINRHQPLRRRIPS